MTAEFEKGVIEKLSKIEEVSKEIKELIKGLGTLNRNIEKLIKVLVEKEGKKED